jgi:DNA-binding NtrC family response regulator
MATLTALASNRVSSESIGVLVVSSNGAMRRALIERLRSSRCVLSEAESGAAALEMMYESESHVLLLDPMLPDLEPTEFGARLREQFPDVQIVTVNSHTGQPLLRSSSPTPLASQVIEILERCGVVPAAVATVVDAADERHNDDPESGLPGMVGNSAAMRQVYAVTRLIARRETTVMIMGESGTGKDLVAQAIHLLSPRRNRPFAVINCAAIPEALLEAELFGYVKGAFTGAVQSRIGRIHAAQGGTLLLDEIGEMPLGLQSKLLRFVEQGEVQRLGSTDNFRVDVRVLAATNADLRKLLSEKAFREDLYYRLAVFPIKLPPLREHAEDISPLAASFATRFNPGSFLNGEALSILQQHTWPGNVRELRNVIERAFVLAGNDPELNAEHILL